jgi:hypothetical protein
MTTDTKDLANLEGLGRDTGWARDGSGRLKPLNTCFALANRSLEQPYSERRLERDPSSRGWIVIDGSSTHGPFDDRRRAHIFMKNLKPGV